MTDQNDHSNNAADLLAFMWQWRKHLIIITALAAVLSAVVSLLITEKYEGVVVLFPAESNSVSKAMLQENFGGKADLTRFGEEDEAEQLLQVLNSNEIRERMLRKYNLLAHYDIKKDSKYPMTEFMDEWGSNVHFKRTEFQSVRITVLDRDPDTAAMIANDIAALVDTVHNRMIHERANQVLTIVEEQYVALKDHINNMEDSLTTLSEMGVQEYEVQIEKLTQGYSDALVAGKTAVADKLQKQMNELAKYGNKYVSLKDRLIEENKKASYLRSRYQEARVDASQNIPHKFTVNRAYPAEKKKYPVRWLIVVVSAMATFLLSLLFIILLTNLGKIRRAMK